MYFFITPNSALKCFWALAWKCFSGVKYLTCFSAEVTGLPKYNRYSNKLLDSKLGQGSLAQHSNTECPKTYRKSVLHLLK